MQIAPIPTLSEEINDIRLRTADIVGNRIIPNEKVIYSGGEKSAKLRKDIRKEVKKQGLWAPHLPEEYGGMGNGFLTHAYMNEILAWSPLGNRLFGVIAPNSGNQKILVKYGTEEQKKKWLMPLINQEMESGFSMTEPDSPGSDPRSLKTTAVKDGDEWVINGHKIMTSNGQRADFLVVMCRTEDDDGDGSFDEYSGAEEFLNEFGGNAVKSPFQDGHYIYTVIAGSGSGTSSISPILFIADLESAKNFHKKLQP